MTAKFGGHRHCSSGDIMVLVGHIILKDHMLKRSSGFLDKSASGKSPSCQVW